MRQIVTDPPCPPLSAARAAGFPLTGRLLDGGLFLLLMTGPIALLLSDAEWGSRLMTLMLLVLGASLASFAGSAGARWFTAGIVGWGFLSSIDNISTTVHLGACAISFKNALVSLILFHLVGAAWVRRRSHLAGALQAGLAACAVLLLAPAALVSGAMTLQTPLALLHAIIFVHVADSLRQPLDKQVYRRVLSAYCVALAVLVIFQGVSGA